MMRGLQHQPIFISAISILLFAVFVFTSNIIPQRKYFVLRYKDKIQSASYYHETTVNNIHECINFCTEDKLCKSVNFNYDGTSLKNCQLINKDINTNLHYEIKEGWIHYDTGKTLSQLINHQTGYCWLPETKSCTGGSPEKLILSDNEQECSSVYAYYKFDVYDGSLIHYCSGMPLCPMSKASGSYIVKDYGCSQKYTNSIENIWYINWGMFYIMKCF